MAAQRHGTMLTMPAAAVALLTVCVAASAAPAAGCDWSSLAALASAVDIACAATSPASDAETSLATLANRVDAATSDACALAIASLRADPCSQSLLYLSRRNAAAGDVGRPAIGPIARLLANVACEQYADALRERGWDDMETLKRASWLDLVNIGMKPGHARRFYEELHGTREG
eukprot:COSAG04_NODE_121_length_24915_cov_61.932181_13_plen_174_part_00